MTCVDDRHDVGVSTLVPARDWTPQIDRWLREGLIAALPGLKMAELFSARPGLFRDADLVTLATGESDRSVIGALASRWCALPSGRPFLHILAQFVGERYRHGVVFRRSWASHFSALASVPGLIVLKTANPVVYCAMRSFTRIPEITMYPDIPLGSRTAEPDTGTARLAAQVAEEIAPGHPFCAPTAVIRDAGVPPDLYPRLPESAASEVNEYFNGTIRPQDRVLCMLTVPTPRAGSLILGAFGVSQASEAR